MKGLFRYITISILSILILCIGIAAGVILERQGLVPFGTSKEIPQNAEKDFGLMAEAWNTIQQNYADQTAVQPKEMTYGAISGMVDALGDTGHSRFLSPEMVKEEHNYTQGEFEGIGALMQMKDGHVMVITAYSGSPAEKAGLRSGDILIKVDGQDITGLTLGQVVSRVVGPAGTTVTLTIMDPKTNETRDLAIVRARIEVKNVTWQILPGTKIAHVLIAAFSEGVTQDLKLALQDLQGQGVTGLILDLRNDSGGLVDEATGVTSQFLKNGNVLLEKDSKGNVKEVPVKAGGVARDLPMVVLVNGGSASASEIVAGALQDAQRAKLVGETTFGTGTVLLEFPLSDGSELLLATKEWLTPKGRVIWHQGIAPDISVSLPSNVAPLIPDLERDMTPEQLRASQDTQLLQALTLLP